jgi:lipopolysaccharide transport system permease protein
MATTIDHQQATTTRSRLQTWGDYLTRQRAGLHLYQWLWILLCMVVALVVFAPRILSQPVVYHATAETRFDVDRYGGLYNPDGTPGPDFYTAINDATNTINQRLLAQREVRFGKPTYRIEYTYQEPGVVQVTGIAPTAAEAKTLADRGAEELVRQIQAAGGREILRNLLGWELVAAMRGEQMTSPFEHHLRLIIERNAFPMSRPIEPVSARMHVEDLTPEERDDLTRALEARYDLWSFEIHSRNTRLDALCGTGHLTITDLRNAALQACAHNGPGTAQGERQEAVQEEVQRELDELERAIARRHAINGALNYMLQHHETAFKPEQPDVAYRTSAALPLAPVPRHIAPLLALTVLIGLTAGAASVAIDRSAGVMPKVRELWSYRELISDLVVRDLRARYKSSMLGYLWTQLAPLMMMLVFTFVFSVMMPNGLALFPVFVIVGLLPWNYCTEAVSGGTRSVIDNANLIKKVFFPREILPLVSVFSSLLNYLLSLPMMFLVMAVTQLLTLGYLNFSLTFLYLPVIILIQTMFLIGVTLFLSALAVFFRDVTHLIGIVILFWFFLTPVFYTLDIVSSQVARLIRWLNPMASMVEFYREILYGNAVGIGKIPTPAIPAPDSLLRIIVTTGLVLALGYWFFQRHSGQFGEEL